jgi:hypothetical protein
MLPDFVAQLSAMGVTEAELQPLLNSADAFVQLWTRTEQHGSSSGELLGPSAVVAADSKQFVFWKGIDGNLWQAIWDGSAWSARSPFGMGPLGSGPTAGVDRNDATYVLWKGADGNLWQAYWDGSAWAYPLGLGMGPQG